MTIKELTEANLEEWLEEWMNLSTDLRSMKKLEMEVRVKLVSFMEVNNFTPGTYRHDFTSIYATITLKNNVTIDKTLLEGLVDEMTQEEKDCIQYKPNLLNKNYKLLAVDERETLDKCLSVKPAAPALKVDYQSEEQ